MRIAKNILVIIWLAGLTACSFSPQPVSLPTISPTPLPGVTTTSPPPTAVLTSTQALTATPVPTPTAQPTAVSTPAYPLDGYGPTNFPANVDPLTGLAVTDPALVNRRPMIIKVENLPRENRPQWGLSFADLIYEYYTEFGTTRFAPVFYGKDAEKVGPIRSARFFDVNLIRMYKTVFAFGSAYEGVMDRLLGSEFANRLVLEGENRCPPMCRFEPEGRNLLMSNTADLSQYASRVGIDNSRQNLDGMLFQLQPPAQGQALNQVFVRFSGSIYNRWDYDPASGRYLRFVDTQDDVDRVNEVYVQLTDKQTNQPIAADNLVVLLVKYSYVVKTDVSEVLDMDFTGSGPAYLFRDGQAYEVTWQRPAQDSVLSLAGPDGKPVAFKPGTTWFEVMGTTTRLDKKADNWRFSFSIP
jgi:hypothetical protein